jgi:2-polyprenyl-3-methyl-5-hydroxy-6-metoxy-1,4-benzoquinol methylase
MDLDEQSQHWDARYAERGARMWSGRPNGTLVAEVAALTAAGLTPGTVLDVGCGEGADAIWFARQGWQVTVPDITWACE